MNTPDPLDEVFGPAGDDSLSPTPLPQVQAQIKKRTLLDIGDDMTALDDLVDEMGGDVSDPQIESIIDRWFNDLQENLKDKVDGYCAYITELEGRASIRKAEKQRLEKLQKSDEALAAKLRERLKYFFLDRGLPKLDTTRYRISVRKNGGKLPLIIKDEADPALVDERFHKVEYKFNTDSIREALDKDEKLEFAHYGERGTSLQIK